MKTVEDPQRRRKNGEKEKVKQRMLALFSKLDLGSLEKTKEGPNLKTSLKYLC